MSARPIPLSRLDLRRLAAVELIFLDCDGVLTDGRVWVDSKGNETKAFSVIDGHGLWMIKDAGVRLALVTRDRSGIPRARASKLRFDFIETGVDDKARRVAAILGEVGLAADEAAYIGDDVPDLEAFELVGLTIAPSTARPEIVAVADVITAAPGGAGAVREVCDAILRARTTRGATP